MCFPFAKLLSCLSVVFHLFIVLFSLSTFPLTLWSVIEHVKCLMKNLSQKFLNFLLVKAVPGSVRICLGIPLSAIYLFRNTVTVSVTGHSKIGHLATRFYHLLIRLGTFLNFWLFKTDLQSKLLIRHLFCLVLGFFQIVFVFKLV